MVSIYSKKMMEEIKLIANDAVALNQSIQSVVSSHVNDALINSILSG